LRRDDGGETFLRNLWREAGLLLEARTTREASDNFVLAASKAAGRDLGGLFAGPWRWPVAQETRNRLRVLFPT
jgi:hypothetical protein